MSPVVDQHRFEGLSREELTHDIHFNLGASVVGATLTSGIAYATVEFFQNKPSALELTFAGSSLSVVGIVMAVGGVRNAVGAIKQRRRLDQEAADNSTAPSSPI